MLNVRCRKRDVLHTSPVIPAQEPGRQRLYRGRGVERQPQTTIRGVQRLALDETYGVGDFDERCLGNLEQSVVVQEPGEHLFVLHRLGDVIDPK